MRGKGKGFSRHSYSEEVCLMAKEILDVGAAAEYLHITRATLYKLAKEKKIPGLKIGGQWRFSRERLDELFSDGLEEEIQSTNKDTARDKTRV